MHELSLKGQDLRKGVGTLTIILYTNIAIYYATYCPSHILHSLTLCMIL